MRKYLSLGFALLAQFLKARMVYRGDFLVSLFTTVLSTGLGLVFMFTIFRQITALDSWSFYEVLLIYGLSLVPLSIFSLVSFNLWSFGEKYIVEGAFDRVLLRPLHSLFQVLCESFRLESIPDMLLGMYLVTYALQHLSIEIHAWQIVGLVILLVSAVIILLGFFGIIAAVNFWVADRVGIEAPFFNMIALSRYPLTIYSAFLRVLLSTLVPFAYIAFYPATFIIGRSEFTFFVAITPLVAVVFLWACLKVWDRGVRNYQSTGH